MVLLINPQSNSGLTEMRQPSTGLAYIGAFLHSKGINVKGIDAKVDNLLPGKVVEKALRLNFDVVGITAMTPDIKAAGSIAKGIKKARPSTLIVVGGAHATAMPEITLKEFDAFDVAAFSEGEFLLYDLIKAYAHNKNRNAFSEIPGIVYRKDDGTLVRTTVREPIKNLDALPFPKWDLFPPCREYPIYGSRGCPFQCIFCQRVLGNRARKRSPENVLSEIRLLISKKERKYFWFDDETLGVDKKWLNTLLDLMIDDKIFNKCRWSANSRANLADINIYRKMKQAGCHRVCFGIESGDDDILKRSNKGINRKMALEAVKMAKAAGLQVGAFYILGHPNETIGQVLQTINFAAKINAYDSSIGIMIPYPGTEIYEMAKKGEGGYISLSKDWDRYTKYFGNPMEFENFSSKTLERLQMLGFLWVYLRNRRFAMIWSEFKRRKNSIINRILGRFAEKKTQN